jgi:hypothetical protein
MDDEKKPAISNIIFGDLVIFAVACLFCATGYLLHTVSAGGGLAFALVVGIGGLAPFFVSRKHFSLKLLCCGASIGSLVAIAWFNGIFYELGLSSLGADYYSGHYVGLNPAMLNPLVFVLLFGAIIVSSDVLCMFAIKKSPKF